MYKGNAPMLRTNQMVTASISDIFITFWSSWFSNQPNSCSSISTKMALKIWRVNWEWSGMERDYFWPNFQLGQTWIQLETEEHNAKNDVAQWSGQIQRQKEVNKTGRNGHRANEGNVRCAAHHWPGTKQN
jgi:hypothetical protein